MTIAGWLLAHNVVSLLLALGFASSVLSQRRPTGTAFAWLLIIFLAPYIGIPLYLSFGGRKVKRGQGLDESRARFSEQPAAAIDWLDDGVQAHRAFLDAIAGAQRTIRICTYVVGNDATGNALVEALAREGRARRRGRAADRRPAPPRGLAPRAGAAQPAPAAGSRASCRSSTCPSADATTCATTASSRSSTARARSPEG